MFEESNKDTCILYCDSGCIDGVILKVDRDDCDCCLSLVSDNYLVMQQSGWERFKEKCKRIWRIIANKELVFSLILLKVFLIDSIDVTSHSY